MDTLSFARLHPDAKPPVRKHPTDAGADVFALETVVIPPFSAARVRTGLTFDIPAGRMLSARPKSGADFLLGAGVIDSGYQGEVLIKIVNYTPDPWTIPAGSAIAQLVLVWIDTPALVEKSVEEIHAQASERGADGGIARQAGL